MANRVSPETATATGGGTTAQKLAFSVDVPIYLDIAGDNLNKYVLRLVKDGDSNSMMAAVNGYGESPVNGIK